MSSLRNEYTRCDDVIKVYVYEYRARSILRPRDAVAKSPAKSTVHDLSSRQSRNRSLRLNGPSKNPPDPQYNFKRKVDVFSVYPLYDPSPPHHPPTLVDRLRSDVSRPVRPRSRAIENVRRREREATSESYVRLRCSSVRFAGFVRARAAPSRIVKIIRLNTRARIQIV